MTFQKFSFNSEHFRMILVGLIHGLATCCILGGRGLRPQFPCICAEDSYTSPYAWQARRFFSALAQLVEQLTVNQRVAGSSPAGGAN